MSMPTFLLSDSPSPPCYLSAIDILNQLVLYCGNCPMYCRMFKQFPWPLPIDTRSPHLPPPSYDNQKCPQTLSHAPSGTKSPLVEKHLFTEEKRFYLYLLEV